MNAQLADEERRVNDELQYEMGTMETVRSLMRFRRDVVERDLRDFPEDFDVTLKVPSMSEVWISRDLARALLRMM